MEQSSVRRVTLLTSALAGLAALLGVSLGGCYHMAFDQPRSSPLAAASPAASPCPDCAGGSSAAAAAGTRYKMRRSTYLLGAIGEGRVDTSRYCSDPVRMETKATFTDVALGVVTMGIYTPRHLYVTCPTQVGGVQTSSAAGSTFE